MINLQDLLTLEGIITFLISLVAFFISVSFHEFAHGFAAVKCGDMTPKLQNRYTLNPLAHFDLTGLICFLFAGFGSSRNCIGDISGYLL